MSVVARQTASTFERLYATHKIEGNRLPKAEQQVYRSTVSVAFPVQLRALNDSLENNSIMSRCQIFVGAPLVADLYDPQYASTGDTNYRWRRTVTVAPSLSPPSVFPSVDVYNLPAATLEAASRRISRLYENIIFTDDNDPEEQLDEVPDEDVIPPGAF